jgi:hypothetical protein
MIQKVYTRKLGRENIFIIWKVYNHTSRSEEEMIMIQKVHHTHKKVRTGTYLMIHKIYTYTRRSGQEHIHDPESFPHTQEEQDQERDDPESLAFLRAERV